MDWQTIAAVSIVVATVGIFLVRFMGSRGKSSCGHGCGCSAAPRTPTVATPSRDDLTGS